MKAEVTNEGKKLKQRFPEIHFLDNGIWQSAVTAYGGQLLSVQHISSPEEVIFLGSKAHCLKGNAIRGGVPLCWPWFGASSVPGRPIQGFARTAMWQLCQLEKDFIRMQLPETAVPQEQMDFPFELFSEVRLTDALEISLVMKNCGDREAEISCALHTYFAVSDCEKVTLRGLENTPFTVKGGPEETPEKLPLQIKGEVCRLYAPQSGELILTDPLWKRELRITKENSNSTLVWNPGSERCRQIADLEDGEYRRFLCIECNRAGTDTLLLPPGRECRIVQKIKVAPL